MDLEQRRMRNPAPHVSCCETGDHVSSLPLSNRVGTPIMGNTDNASGLFNRALI